MLSPPPPGGPPMAGRLAGRLAPDRFGLEVGALMMMMAIMTFCLLMFPFKMLVVSSFSVPWQRGERERHGGGVSPEQVRDGLNGLFDPPGVNATCSQSSATELRAWLLCRPLELTGERPSVQHHY